MAVEKGANVIFVVDVGERRKHRREVKGAVGVVRRVIEAATYQRYLDDVGMVKKSYTGELHYINIDAFGGTKAWDFSHTKEMIEVGKQTTLQYLEQKGLIAAGRKDRVPVGKAVPGA